MTEGVSTQYAKVKAAVKGKVCREVGEGSTKEARNVVSSGNVCIMTFVFAFLCVPYFITASLTELLERQFVAVVDRHRDKVLAQPYIHQHRDANLFASFETSIRQLANISPHFVGAPSRCIAY